MAEWRCLLGCIDTRTPFRPRDLHGKAHKSQNMQPFLGGGPSLSEIACSSGLSGGVARNTATIEMDGQKG